MVQERDDVVLIDAAILGPPQVWEASGHLANFTDPLVDCTNCKNRFRLDKLDDPNTCPSCGKHGTFTEARQFNLMFKTQAGPVEDSAAVAYLRPETAQGMFVNFAERAADDAQEAAVRHRPGRQVVPQRDHAAELDLPHPRVRADGAGVLRARRPRAPQWYEYWCAERLDWYVRHGIPADQLRLRPHDADELSHYSAGTSDVEFLFPWGFDELEGIAQRTDYDLKAHAAALRRAARLLRPADQRALRALRHRAGGRRHPHDGRVPAVGVRRGRHQRRGPHRAAPAPAPRAVHRSPCCRCRRRTR